MIRSPTSRGPGRSSRGVRVKVVTLSPGFEHASMLDDPVVRKEILGIVAERDQADQSP